MNKSELVADIASRSGLSQADSKKALEALVGSITDLLVAGGKLQLVGFGTFKVSERAARTGINPSTKQQIQIPAKKVPTFTAGSELKAAVNK
jgi:DNA-binding protein HU-beta